MSKKIKILHILPSLTRGGAEKVCFDIISNINRDEFSPSLILFKDNGEGLKWKSILKEKNIPVYSLNKKYQLDLKNIWQLYRLIMKIKPDIVHTHLGADVYGRISAYLAGVKAIVSTEHNINISEKTSISWLKKITSGICEQIFAVSQAVKQDAIKRYGLKSEKLIVIYNGIDVNHFKNTFPAKKLDKGEIVIGAMGRLTKQKGFHLLIEAAEKIRYKNYKIQIAGSGELEHDLRRQISRLGLEDKLKLVGKVEAREFFKGIDIFVFPSLWEGLGLVALEAASMYKPIIASATGGIKEIISIDSGYLFKAGDEHDLAAKINEVIAHLNDETVSQKVSKAYEIVSQRFSLDKMIFDYSVWYRKLYKK